jgi:GTP-binding protein
VPRGGPSGGDGGNGGSIWFVADENLTTLLDYRYRKEFTVHKGENGQGSDCNGKGSEDVELRVPVGTVVRTEDGAVLFDLSRNGQRALAAKGGRGGLGNMNFATSTRQAPTFAQEGTPGESRSLRLELRLLADAGLIGYPNAGKSTLISVISAARPKIANYPFTTLVPNLGVVSYRNERSFVVADIPGLVEGAHAGHGLGHRFLRHVERCRVLVHLVDCGGEEGREPLHDYEVINQELALYSPRLATKPQIVVATKLDIPGASERADALEAALAPHGHSVLRISAVTRDGLSKLLDAMVHKLDEAGPPQWVPDLAQPEADNEAEESVE